MVRISFVGLVAALSAAPASAAFIQNSNSGDLFGDAYSYLFTISDTADPDVFTATLTNTSPDPTPGDPSDDPLISLLAFNIEAVFGVDYTIGNLSPAWVVDGDPPPGVDFDVVIERDDPGDRLAAGEVLTFDFIFTEGFNPTFDLWLLTDLSDGGGLGGGDDEGQKAVKFQQLGSGGGGSDLLASNWGPDIQETTEPSTLVLMGTGLLGIASLLRRRQKARG